ncbi:hypothetical protein [Sphingomonas melonis]|uniref:Uncharacterized protein n=1 Tax=Sphingomonas melonis TaxID=152682 RepID=A0A7Y9FKX7_9SPHN|nr:hypothetical protein [Sphingomonas melonis]NYD89215.1 hypothetical protein [Sphingomonas melonis]
MPASKRKKPLYERGGYKLVHREGRALEIIWYDTTRKRERSVSAGTEDVEEGRDALDRLYLERTKGEGFCPTCGQRKIARDVFVTAAIADHLTLSVSKPSIQAIRARLKHVLQYIVTTDQSTISCDAVDEGWIAKFRVWFEAQPIVSPKGRMRARSLSTIENSVLQLAAAINQCGATDAKFRPRQPKDVNRTPQHRSDVAELAAMFRHCLQPGSGKQPPERARRERAGLLGFLRISVTSLARPDAAMSVSTDPLRKQWNSKARILNLNPDRRAQTRKYRATVPIGERMAQVLDSTDGYIVASQSIRSAWETMAAAIGLPRDGEAGTKLIRRSMADLLRRRLPQEAWGEIEIFLGHDRFDDVSGLYAPLRPDYLRRALAAIDEIVAEIDDLVPGAFPPPSSKPEP